MIRRCIQCNYGLIIRSSNMMDFLHCSLGCLMRADTHNSSSLILHFVLSGCWPWKLFMKKKEKKIKPGPTSIYMDHNNLINITYSLIIMLHRCLRRSVAGPLWEGAAWDTLLVPEAGAVVGRYCNPPPPPSTCTTTHLHQQKV